MSDLSKNERKLDLLLKNVGRNSQEIKLCMLKVIVNQRILGIMHSLNTYELQFLLKSLLLKFYSEENVHEANGIESDEFIGMVSDRIVESQDINKPITEVIDDCLSAYEKFIKSSVNESDEDKVSNIFFGKIK